MPIPLDKYRKERKFLVHLIKEYFEKLLSIDYPSYKLAYVEPVKHILNGIITPEEFEKEILRIKSWRRNSELNLTDNIDEWRICLECLQKHIHELIQEVRRGSIKFHFPE